MRFVIAAVGRLKDDAERRLVDRYTKRIADGRRLGLGPLVEKEIPESRLATADLRRAEESTKLLKLCTDAKADLRIVLDERGKALSSTAFAQWLGTRRDDDAQCAAFLIGGPDGHGAAVREGAHLVLSLGAMTLPHGLARAVLAEQLYRATTILAGHPYHRE
jgi:23S rRNA (pseudouridine1915-N3)-methyltransferase